MPTTEVVTIQLSTGEAVLLCAYVALAKAEAIRGGYAALALALNPLADKLQQAIERLPQ